MYEKSSCSSTEKTEDTYRQINFNKSKKQFSEYDEQFLNQKYSIYSRRQDDFRCELAYKEGGFICKDEKQVEKLRSVGKEMIKIIGRKILSGQLNLTKISFPIKACSNRTALQNSVQSCLTFPFFMNRAAATNDPLQRFKLTCVALISSPCYIDMFLKPLNPIIGETLQAVLPDGTHLYCEQISHHPPISYFLAYGPENNYQFSGYYDFQISPGFNSLSLKNKGRRKFVFKNGTEIEATFPQSLFSSTFFGTSRIQQTGAFTIWDRMNGLKLDIQYGKVKRRPNDYFQGYITQFDPNPNITQKQRVKSQKNVQKIWGTYCGYINISDKRYWDFRDFNGIQLNFQQISEQKLLSDFSHRKDLKLLKEGRMQQAQNAKQQLQQIQRNDEKMRKKHKGIMRQKEQHHAYHYHHGQH